MTSTIIIIVLVIALIISLTRTTHKKANALSIGDRFAHMNPGTTHDPTKQPRPFVGMYTVKEIKGENVRLEWVVVHENGDSQKYEVWRAITDITTNSNDRKF